MYIYICTYTCAGRSTTTICQRCLRACSMVSRHLRICEWIGICDRVRPHIGNPFIFFTYIHVYVCEWICICDRVCIFSLLLKSHCYWSEYMHVYFTHDNKNVQMCQNAMACHSTQTEENTVWKILSYLIQNQTFIELSEQLSESEFEYAEISDSDLDRICVHLSNFKVGV
jgi:hypothetical protein